MDTLLIHRPSLEKTATSAASIGIAICLIFTQNLWISARDFNGMTGISPSVMDKKIQEEIFEQEILEKYRDLKVVEVEKGIKHVQMVKYYSGKPVRINIVEISGKLDNIAIEPAIASETLASRSKISKIAKSATFL